MSFGCANEDVYDTCIFEEDLCLYEDGNVDETVQDSIQVKGIFPTGIEESTEIHTIHDRLPHQSPSIKVNIVQPTMEQEERSEICTTLTSFDKSRAPNSHPFKVNFRIPLAGGTSAHIVLKNTCSVDGFLLMIYVLLEENLTIRTQFEHSEHDLHKIYHQIWKKFTEGNFGDAKIAWGKYGGYIEDLEANGARTDKIIDIIGRENERIFCVLAKHRFPLRVHCSLVGDVYFTTQLYNVLPLYEVQGEPLYDTIKRAINKFLRGDDLPCYRTHGYELYLVRFFIEGVNHFVDKIKIYGSWALYDDCREKLYHFDVDPEYVQLSSCYFVKV
ncbi:unnamed protein product [Mytilus edulis]|uniref:Uncharacterized protein n=1 Tax=Mytilus edulis TaxID=6550 RepID=A0A8S3SC00_MYTED|nr:unnamed protein product [Mytilus edulis]